MTAHAAAAGGTGAHTGPFGPDWYQRSLERIDDVVLAIATDGTIMYANPAVLRLFGLTPDEAVGRNCIELVHPDDLERALDNLAYGENAKRVEVPVAFAYAAPTASGRCSSCVAAAPATLRTTTCSPSCARPTARS